MTYIPSIILRYCTSLKLEVFCIECYPHVQELPNSKYLTPRTELYCSLDSFDGKVLVIDSNIKIVMIEGEEKSKHTQKRRKTNSRRRAKEQMQRSKEQPSNITVQHQLYCYTVSYYIIWYSSRSGVEWHFKFLKTR
jgi:hypothetical protein